ncbi:MAG: hypothetical protein WC366_02135 [Bacilli bacterium]|jgi:glutaredoxin
MKKRWFKFFTAIAFSLTLFSCSFQSDTVAYAESDVAAFNVYLFHTQGCPHCESEIAFFDSYLPTHTNITLLKYDISNSENLALLNKVSIAFNDPSLSTPCTVVGGKHYVGFEDSVKAALQKTLERYSQNGTDDVMSYILAGEAVPASAFDTSSDYEITLPLFGTIDVRNTSLFAISIVLGFIDGFNPCAMWVLIFLISMLISVNDKKRVWLLGGAFLLTSSLFYFGVLYAWVTALSFLAAKVIFQIIVGIIALAAGGYNLYKFIKAKIKKEDGCEVTSVKTKQSIAERVKKIALASSFWLALAGVILLAIVVNLIELACSTGLPVLFTQILALNGITGIGALPYILLYLFFFMLDDIVVFAIAVLTFKISPISIKFAKYSSLVGGILMIIIGILMIFFPNILMFAF